MNNIYIKLENLYHDEKTGFLKIINSDGQMHLLNKVKAEFKNKTIIPDHIELQVLEERMTNIQNSKQARFEENKKTYHQISLIFEMVFYIIKSSKDKRNIDFFENSYKEYRNTFLKKEKLTSNSDFEPDVDDFL